MSRLLNLDLKQPQTFAVLVAQSIDTTVALCLGIFFGALVTLFFSSQVATGAASFSWLLLVSGCSLLWALNFMQRLFFVSFLGSTLGQYVAGVRACVAGNDPQFWLGQAIESLHLLLPIIWILETAQRMGALPNSPIRGLRYMVVRQHTV